MTSLPCHSFALFPFHSRSMPLFSSIFLDCFPDGSALSLNCRPSSPFCYPPSCLIYTLLISRFLLLFSPLLSFLLIFPYSPPLYFLFFINSCSSYSSFSLSLSLPVLTPHYLFFSDDFKYHRFTDWAIVLHNCCHYNGEMFVRVKELGQCFIKD